MGNGFKELLFSLINFIEDMMIKYKKENILFQKEEKKKKFFKNDNDKRIYCPVITRYHKFLKDINHCNQLDYIHKEQGIQLTYNEFIRIVNQFCDFLLFADVALFHQNDEQQSIYAEKINENTKAIYFKTKEFKLKITFESSVIPSIGDLTSGFDKILGQDKNLEFITINIVREYGKKFDTTSKFVSGEDISFESKESNILFQIVSNKMKDTIIFTYKVIVEKALEDYFDIIGINLDKLEDGNIFVSGYNNKKFNFFGEINDERVC